MHKLNYSQILEKAHETEKLTCASSNASFEAKYKNLSTKLSDKLPLKFTFLGTEN